MEGKVCNICESKNGRYVCPRCNIVYCSVACYQSESHLNCSEQFYKTCCVEAIKSEENDPEKQKRLMEILERNHEEADNLEDFDSDDEVDLAERLQGVNLDDPDLVWKNLTESEKQEFEDIVSSGDIGHLLSEWEPWWMRSEKQRLIEECKNVPGEIGEDTAANSFKYPALKSDIPKFEQLFRGPPSVFLKYNVLNVLCAYTCMTRYFNGDHNEFPVAAVNVLLKLSGNLQNNTTYNSAESSIGAVNIELLNNPWICDGNSTVDVLKVDIQRLINGPSERENKVFVLAALSDVCNLLMNTVTVSKSPKLVGTKLGEFTARFSNSSVSDIPVSKKTLRACLKKIEFYLSWSLEYFDGSQLYVELCNIH